MTYLKPLSENSLEKKYKESGLNGEARLFLHDFFAACANLYGFIELQDAWSVYKNLKNVPKLRKQDFLAFSSIVRRETQPYFVFEIEELYSEGKNNDFERHIVNKELISEGYGKFGLLYLLMEQIDKPYNIPDNFLSYAKPVPSAEEKALLNFLSNLTTTTDKCVPNYGESIPNIHKGKKLDSFSFMNALERFNVEYEKRPSFRSALIAEYSVSEAEKILNSFKREEHIGTFNVVKLMQKIVDELNEVGVEFSKKQLEKLFQLVVKYNNNSRLWHLSGWKPIELSDFYRNKKGPAAIAFGEGYQKAFAEGLIDKEELIRKIREAGLDVIE
jgi:hypothetical protein